MITELATGSNWLAGVVDYLRYTLSWRVAPPAVPRERPSLFQLAQPGVLLPRFVAECAVAHKYLDLLGPLDWDHFPERDPHRPWPGPQPAPRAPFVAAYLVKLDQQKRYVSDLREYLAEHPALVWVLGFPGNPPLVPQLPLSQAPKLPVTRYSAVKLPICCACRAYLTKLFFVPLQNLTLCYVRPSLFIGAVGRTGVSSRK
jgi:hypothetical protein